MSENANNKVYYGEYSLKHWIDLILSKNIVLPPYQRNFVWTKEKREELIVSIRKKEFIPPVLIGSFYSTGKLKQHENLLIDGQQRLTSILLSAIGYFPNRENFKQNQKNFIDDKNNEDQDPNADPRDDLLNVIDWSFKDLLKDEVDYSIDFLRKKIEKINKSDKSNERDESFERLDNTIDEKFLEDHYLGFSYLVPVQKKNKKYQQEYYSSVFRSINIQGQTLLPQESRASLYYLEEGKRTFFDPDFLNEHTLTSGKLDFVRYLAILSWYHKDPDRYPLCKGYGRKLEELYYDFIQLTIKSKTSKDFFTYDELFVEKKHENRMKKLKDTMESLKVFDKKYDSIIDIDMYFFGLIYLIIFEKQELKLDEEQQKKLFSSLNEKIKEFKRVEGNNEDINYHRRNPSALKYLTDRVNNSINIYTSFLEDSNE